MTKPLGLSEAKPLTPAMRRNLEELADLADRGSGEAHWGAWREFHYTTPSPVCQHLPSGGRTAGERTEALHD